MSAREKSEQRDRRASPGANPGRAPTAVRGTFPDLDISVMLPRDAEGDRLIRDLQKTRARVRHVWSADGDIPTDTDMLFCALSDDLPRRLPWLPGSPPLALVIVLPAAGGLNAEALRNCAPHGVIQLPVAGEVVPAVLETARGQYLYACRMQRRIEKLDENLRTIRNVERAKGILISTRRMSEEEAYRFLRKRAMERRVTIGALASLIVDSEDLLA